MTVPFLDLGRPMRELRAEIQRAVEEVLDSGTYVLGPTVKAFERAFADYCGAAYAIGVASGTDGLTLALRALGVGAGDEVLTAANTCVPTIAGIEAAGATPVLVDVDEATYTLDAARLEEATGERTRAIVPVHLYGQCADMAAITAFARARGLKVVEDAAQAHGAEFDGRRAGTLGDAAAFSFYPTKNLGAIGDAGAVVTDDPGVAERVRSLRVHGERERYNAELRGTNSRLAPVQAAALSVKLRHLDRWNERRRELADRYCRELAGVAVRLPSEGPGRRHAYHLFVARVPDRERFRAAMAAAGVQTLVHYPRPVHRQPAYSELARGRSLTTAERLCSEVVSLPLYPQLRDDEAAAVVDAVRRAA